MATDPVTLTILNNAFGTVPLGLDQWLVCVAMASGVLWVSELRKLIAFAFAFAIARAARR